MSIKARIPQFASFSPQVKLFMQRVLFLVVVALVCGAFCCLIGNYVIHPLQAMQEMKQNNAVLAQQREALRLEVEAKHARIEEMNSPAGAEREARYIGMVKPNEQRVQLELTTPAPPPGPTLEEIAAQNESRFITGAWISIGALAICAYAIFHLLARRRRKRRTLTATAKIVPGHG